MRERVISDTKIGHIVTTFVFQHIVTSSKIVHSTLNILPRTKHFAIDVISNIMVNKVTNNEDHLHI